MTARTTAHRLEVATELHRFIEEKVLPATGVDSSTFWRGFDAIVHDYKITDPAVLELAKIVRAADVSSQRRLVPEGAGLELLADGFRRTSKDDHENLARQFHVYDALYAAVKARLEGPRA